MPNRLPTPFSRRRLLLAGIAASLAACRSGVAEGPGAPAEQRLRLLAEARWAHRLDFAGTPVGGLSGIDYDRSSGEYLLLSDDRSDLAPARFYSARWPAVEGAAPQATGVALLRQADGAPWPARGAASPGTPVVDPEAIRWRPDTGTVLWTSEGDVARGFGPALHESRRDGTLVRQIGLPPMFEVDRRGRRGPRDNLGLEGLALTPDGRDAWVAMENALLQDGPVPTLGAPGGPCRFTRIELAGGQARRQIAYVPDAIPLRPLVPGSYADNGVSEVLMIDAHRMLVLERAYAAGTGNSLRLYEIDTREGSDTLALDALAPDNHRPVPKKRVADFALLGLSRLDNSEGLCWGPDLPNGRRLLVVLSDDNFNPLQVTQFAAFEFTDKS
ncbi:esterase-like activity of phytase family protein [Variovorax saccharolyticus]|uniref:esterase-like activity of phytase family protein n=1 Tax=Variovorax saccharolyticus TaxID=3053516 RepID=UPI0025785CC9|nr:esterase-like activity of phytase family protein [Variovorax sp. J22R187]MDM0017410.1 esterase-like activity of phytase family protein [Variovorax sp. J22R187]